MDATPPLIEFGPLDGGLLTFTITGDGSGLYGEPTLAGAGGEEIEVIRGADGTYAAQIDPDQPFVTATAIDGGLNAGTATRVLSPSTVVLDNASQLGAGVIGPASPGVQDDVLTLRGHVSADIAALTVAGREVSIEDGAFAAQIDLAEGAQSVDLVAADAAGVTVFEDTYDFVYDVVAPELTITDMETDEYGDAVLTEDGSVVVRGTVTDDRPDAELVVLSGTDRTDVAADGSFELTVTPGAEVIGFALLASDPTSPARRWRSRRSTSSSSRDRSRSSSRCTGRHSPTRRVSPNWCSSGSRRRPLWSSPPGP